MKRKLYVPALLFIVSTSGAALDEKAVELTDGQLILDKMVEAAKAVNSASYEYTAEG